MTASSVASGAVPVVSFEITVYRTLRHRYVLDVAIGIDGTVEHFNRRFTPLVETSEHLAGFDMAWAVNQHSADSGSAECPRVLSGQFEELRDNALMQLLAFSATRSST